MKKIVLGCAAVLLSLGLLAGCNNDAPIEDAVLINVDSAASVEVGDTLTLSYSVSPEKATVVAASDNEGIVTADAQDGLLYLTGVTEGKATVTLVGTYKKYADANVNIAVEVISEATEKTEPGVPDTEKTDPVIGTVTEGEYWLGFTMGEVDYYFDGSLSGYYGSVTSDGWNAALVTVEAVTEGGYTLSFTGEEGKTQYLYAYVAGDYVDLGIQDDPFTWQYDTAFETFVVELNDQWNFIGTYGSYVSLSMNDYGYLTGDTETSNAQYPAKLFTPIDYSAPTSIAITGETQVEVYKRITLTATVAPEDADPQVVWSWETKESGEVTVTSAGVVTGVTAGTVTVTATSVNYPSVSGSIDITVIASTEDATAYKLGSLDTYDYCYYWFNGKTTGSTFLATSTSWDEAVYVYIAGISNDSIDNSCTLSFYDDSGAKKYITCTSNATSITLGDDPCTWIWNENDGNGYFSAAAEAANGRFIGESGDGSFRAYASSNLSGYPHVQPFTEKPEDPVKPEQPELEEVTSLTDGQTYYFGAQASNDLYYVIDGKISSNYLETTPDFNSAVQVTATEVDGKWKLTINDQYIYVYNNSGLKIGLSNAETVPNDGVNLFSWSSTYKTLYQESVYSNDSYKCVYFEYYSRAIQPYGVSAETSTFSNAAHFYQVVE